MRSLYVFLCLLLIVSAGVAAAPLSGTWQTDITAEVDTLGSVTVKELTSSLLVAFDAGACLATSIVQLNQEHGLARLAFVVDSSLGAFTWGALTSFDATGDPGAFEQLDVYISTSLTGAHLYAFATIEGTQKAGALAGVYGSVGPCDLGAEIDLGAGLFPFSPLATLIHGISETVEDIWQRNIACWGDSLFAHDLSTCDVTFRETTLAARFPFACLDLVSITQFSCADGFTAILYLQEIDLGLSWLKLGPSHDGVIPGFRIGFFNLRKSVDISFSLELLKTTCITPYVSVILGKEGDDTLDHQFEGIQLDAVVLETTMNGISVFVTELFSGEYFMSENGKPCQPFGFSSCCTPIEGSEAIGIEIDGDSCCGGSFDFGLYTFFRVNDPGFGLLGWRHTRATLEYGVSENFTLDAGFSAWRSGVPVQFHFGFEFTWGSSPRLAPCCTGLRFG